MASFSFLSDIQNDQAPARPSPQQQYQQPGRPHFEHSAAPIPYHLENAPMQLQGSKMFTPLDGAAAQQQQPNPIHQLQQANTALRQKIVELMQHIQQQQQQQQHQQQQLASKPPSKRTTEVMVSILLVLFIAVLVTMFVFCRKLSQKL